MLSSLSLANTIGSSKIYFEGSLSDDGDGSYTGTIEAMPGTYYIIGGPGCTGGLTPDGSPCDGGFDVYAREGADAYYDDAVQGVIGADHDAYSSGGGWGAFWDPDVPDYYHYQLTLAGDNWYLEYKGTNLGTPMSGTVDWNNMFAAEMDVGSYRGTVPADPDANDGDAALNGGGPQAWDMDWTWGSEVIPLEYAGFEMTITDLGNGNHSVVFTPFSPSIVYVDDDAVCNGNLPCYTTIQAGVNAVADGGSVIVYDGAYAGFKIEGRNDILIQGSWDAEVSGSPIIHTVDSNDYKVLIDVVDSTDITIKRLTLDAIDIDGTYFRAIYYSNSDGTIEHNTIKNIYSLGGQKRSGIWVESSQDIEILDNIIDEFGKGGIVVYYASSIRIEGNTITTTDHSIAPNGIQIGYLLGTGYPPAIGIMGTISDNEISGCSWDDYDSNEGYDGATWTGAGILIMDTAADLDVSDNDVHDCDVGIDVEAGSSTEIQNNKIYDNIYGFVSWNENPTINYNKIYDNDEYGVFRTSMGSGTGVLNAENNWWGSSTGPYNPTSNPGGTGNAVTDDVDFDPWLTIQLTLNSPQDTLDYGERRILLDASTAIPVDVIEYSLDGSSFRRLCRDCDSYSRDKSFRDGSHELEVRAVIDGSMESVTVNFFVDSDEPNIRKITPEDGDIVHGTLFYIKYTEENLESLKLFWKESAAGTYNEEVLTCPSGRNQECEIDLPLSPYDGSDINFYFELTDPANTVESEVRTITIDDTAPVVTINSPEAKIYPERRILVDVDVTEMVEKLEYSLDGGSFRRLCRNCDSYSREKSFRDGVHTLTVRATDYVGNVGETSVEFSVDSKEPRILKQYPRDRQYTNGTFTVEYTEDNLYNISLFYKGVSDTGYTEVISFVCPAGKKQECNFYADLSTYDGSVIFYYFVVRNGVTETESDVYTETVDTTVPGLTVNSPADTTYASRRVLFDIDVDERVDLEYSDNAGRFRRLCRDCDDYYREKYFRDGTHVVMIKATDEAGNVAIEPITFTIV